MQKRHLLVVSLLIALISSASTNAAPDHDKTTDVLLKCWVSDYGVSYGECRVVAANSVDEANRIFMTANAGDKFYTPEENSKLIKCSDIVGSSNTKGWWSLVVLNSTGNSALDQANASFTCGHRSFEEALKATYIRAAAKAEREIVTIQIWAGIAAQKKNLGDDSYAILTPYSWACLLSLPSFTAPNGVEYEQRTIGYQPLPSTPIDPNLPTAASLLIRACNKSSFKEPQQSYDAQKLPKF